MFARDSATGLLTFIDHDDRNGLGYARSLTVSPDGKHIYVVSSSHDSLIVYARDEFGGQLTFTEQFGHATALDDASSAVVSPDGRHVYVASWVEGEVARLTAERYLRPLLRKGIDTLVLGCTHYPLLKPLIERVAGAGITLVDSAEATAAALEEDLESQRLRTADTSPDVREYFVTDDAERFRAIAKLFLGRPLDHLEPVDLGEPSTP